VKKLIPFVLALFAWGCLVGACSDPPPKLPEPTQAQKEVFANVTFKGQLLECVDKNDTRETQDACATAVIARWGKDGGK
jgi:hypothetical protein